MAGWPLSGLQCSTPVGVLEIVTRPGNVHARPGHVVLNACRRHGDRHIMLAQAARAGLGCSTPVGVMEIVTPCSQQTFFGQRVLNACRRHGDRHWKWWRLGAERCNVLNACRRHGDRHRSCPNHLLLNNFHHLLSRLKMIFRYGLNADRSGTELPDASTRLFLNFRPNQVSSELSKNHNLSN